MTTARFETSWVFLLPKAQNVARSTPYKAFEADVKGRNWLISFHNMRIGTALMDSEAICDHDHPLLGVRAVRSFPP